MLNKKIILFFVAVCCNFISYSQQIELSGLIINNLKKPLEYANITAIPEDNKLQVSYTTTDSLGQYKFLLVKDKAYQLIISHLGYHTRTQKKRIFKNEYQIITLTERIEQLNEITINYTPPITVKKDTTTYNVNAFTNGKERKLKEILKKLPGIEIDREGNITSQGKKVTKVLVEDKTFFTGDSKLAINNIPADAVDKIEILDNYNEVSFLKGLEDSDVLAINVKLKKDKKKFIFGDIEVGTGIKNRYTVHPTLFYYSPKTTVNIIGDLNNTGRKSFTIKNYIDFEGGFGKLMNNTNSYYKLYNSDFSKHLLNEDYKANTNKFGAVNLRHSISKKVDINTYYIINSSSTKTKNELQNKYLNGNNTFIENRLTMNNSNNYFAIGKLTLDYTPNNKEKLSFNSLVKITDNINDKKITTNNPFQNNILSTNPMLKGINIKENLEYSKKLSKAHTISVESNLNYQKDQPNTNWITNEPFLDDLIPVKEDDIYTVLQQQKTTRNSSSLLFKDYWILNNNNHIYSTIGTNLTFENFTSNEEQLLSNESSNGFFLPKFGNNLLYNFNDTFSGIEYKLLTGIFTINTGIFYHNYKWNIKQLGYSRRNHANILLPKINAKAEISNSEKLNFKYSSNIRFPNSSKLLANNLLMDFNHIFKGNDMLTYEHYDTYSLSYSNFNMFRGFNLNAIVYHNHKKRSIKNTTTLNGINKLSTLIDFTMPENDVSANLFFSKKINSIRYGMQTSVSYNEYYQIVNTNTSINKSKTLSSTFKIETLFEEFPNLELGYTMAPSDFKTNIQVTKFSTNKLFINLDYVFFNDFNIKFDYTNSNFINKKSNIHNTFNNANISIFFQKEDSPWGLEVGVKNIFNTEFKQSNSLNDFLITDQKTYILPRITMLKIHYKF